MKYQQMNVTLGISHSTESADYDQKGSNYFFPVLIFLAWPFLSAILAVSTCSHQHSVRLRYSQWATPCHIQSHNQLPLIYTDTSAQGNLSSCDCVWRQHEGLQWECVERLKEEWFIPRWRGCETFITWTKSLWQGWSCGCWCCWWRQAAGQPVVKRCPAEGFRLSACRSGLLMVAWILRKMAVRF